MNRVNDTIDFARGGFLLLEWRVQPERNRLEREQETVQVEPKMMDVLVYLAGRAGDVVSKIEITDAVWPEVFITESVITRAIAGLRRALGDDARSPRFIETISKRGYRLLAVPEPVAETVVTTAPVVARPELPRTPYVVGQWVRAASFYGRSRLINEVLYGNRNWLWLLGTRRIGKTSVLKQLEFLAESSPDLGFVPVFWDLQGAAEPAELHLDFGDALLDAEARLLGHGISLAEVADDDLFVSLGKLRRLLRSRGLTLLLLCDEVEELLQLHAKDPALLRKLRRAMQSSEGLRSVLAASGRLWALAAAEEDTSPFLDGFAPPLYVGVMNDDEAHALVRQTQLAAEVRPQIDDHSVRTIASLCGNHPYLMQLLAKRVLHHGDLDEAVGQVLVDRSVQHFFAVDMGVLAEEERLLLQAVARGDASAQEEALPGVLEALLSLGVLRRGPDGALEVANHLLVDWIRKS